MTKHRWLIAIPVSFLLHAVLGWYFIVSLEPRELDANPASNQPIGLSLSAFKPAVQEKPTPTPEQPLPAPAPAPEKSLDTVPTRAKTEIKNTPVKKPPQKRLAEPTPPQPNPKKESTPEQLSTALTDRSPSDTEITIAEPISPITTDEHAVDQPRKNETSERLTEDGLLLVEDPVYLKKSKPVYPRRAVKANQQGTVIVDATLNDAGLVMETKIFSSSGHELLDRAALAAVKEWQFKPASRNGSPVVSVVRIPVEFKLE